MGSSSQPGGARRVIGNCRQAIQAIRPEERHDLDEAEPFAESRRSQAHFACRNQREPERLQRVGPGPLVSEARRDVNAVLEYLPSTSDLPTLQCELAEIRSYGEDELLVAQLLRSRNALVQ